MNPTFSRPSWVQIDLDALRHNAQNLARLAAPARLIPVVKAGAYGHGAPQIARVLQELPEVAMLAVASVDEAHILRESGIQKPILLFSAILSAEAAAIIELDLTPTVWTLEVARALDIEAKKRGQNRKIHFKVDTGMHRLGATWSEAARDFETIGRLEHLEIEAVYTHFASADENNDFSALQLCRFNEFCAEVELPATILRHTANSAATLRFPDAHFDLVRPGITLYGVHPCRDLAPNVELRPVMTWHARVTAVKTVARGEGVSYGGTWTAPRDSQIATLPAGYADGYLRSLSNCGAVLLNGKSAPVVGRVTMDQTLVDVTDLGTQIGDLATLWGQDWPVEEVAARAETIPYELLCGVAPRVPRLYSE